MTNMIKQIEEAYNTLDNDYILIDGHDGKEVDKARDTAMTALTVLQKIANGDDWFDIESAPRGGDCTLVVKNSTTNGLVKAKELAVYEDIDTWLGLPLPTHWKPLDGAEHIQMLLKEEIENND